MPKEVHNGLTPARVKQEKRPGRETWPLLVQLCRHTIAARRLAQLIHQETHGAEDFMATHFLRLLRALAGQTAIIASVSTKLRLSQQSSYNALSSNTAKRNAHDGPPPWEC